MVATFCLRVAASRFDVRTSARRVTSEISPTVATRAEATALLVMTVASVPRESRAGPLRLAAVRLAGAHHQRQFAILHVLFEHAKLRLLINVEHLVDRLVRLAQLSLGSTVEIVECFQPFAHARLVWRRVVRQPPEFLNHAEALRHVPPANVLER